MADDLLFTAGLKLVRLSQLVKHKAEMAELQHDPPGIIAAWWEDAAETRILGLVCIEASDPPAEQVFGE